MKKSVEPLEEEQGRNRHSYKKKKSQSKSSHKHEYIHGFDTFLYKNIIKGSVEPSIVEVNYCKICGKIGAFDSTDFVFKRQRLLPKVGDKVFRAEKVNDWSRKYVDLNDFYIMTEEDLT